jgi:hypothetical protein
MCPFPLIISPAPLSCPTQLTLANQGAAQQTQGVTAADGAASYDTHESTPSRDGTATVSATVNHFKLAELLHHRGKHSEVCRFINFTAHTFVLTEESHTRSGPLQLRSHSGVLTLVLLRRR